MKTLSIVIVTYKSDKLIDDCLDSIFKYNDIGNELETIIVDNSPMDDPMVNRIKNKYPSLNIIKNLKNGGYGQGNNLGVREANSPYILIMNPDIRLICPFFRHVTDLLKRKDRIGILGLKQVNEYMCPNYSYCYDQDQIGIIKRLLLLPLFCRFDIYTSKDMWISGALLFLNKKHFEEIGMYDENIFMYCEEADITKRFRKHHYQSIYLPKFRYIHLSKQDVKPNAPFTGVITESWLYILKKYNVDLKDFYQRIRRLYRFKLIKARIFRNTNRIPYLELYIRELDKFFQDKISK